jgi:hypothetical protein
MYIYIYIYIYTHMYMYKRRQKEGKRKSDCQESTDITRSWELVRLSEVKEKRSFNRGQGAPLLPTYLKGLQ